MQNKKENTFLVKNRGGSYYAEAAGVRDFAEGDTVERIEGKY